jgi:hypothetical protein
MNENDLRDCFAMFAMNGLIHHYDFDRFKQDPARVATYAYDMADQMLEARKEPEQESGIAAFKPKRRTAKKVSDVD